MKSKSELYKMLENYEVNRNCVIGLKKPLATSSKPVDGVDRTHRTLKLK